MDRVSFYSDFPQQRTRQILSDVVAAVVVILSIVVGATVHGFINAFGAVLGSLEDAGSDFKSTMIDIGETLGGVPLIGDGIRGPFDTVSGAGDSIANAGRAGQEVVATIAVVAGVGVALLPISVLLLVWLWPRLRFARRSAETRALLALEDGESLLALRALGTSTAASLARVSPNPVRAWQQGDAGAVRGLASDAARRSGVRIAPQPRAQRGGSTPR